MTAASPGMGRRRHPYQDFLNAPSRIRTDTVRIEERNRICCYQQRLALAVTKTPFRLGFCGSSHPAWIPLELLRLAVVCPDRRVIAGVANVSYETREATRRRMSAPAISCEPCRTLIPHASS